MDFYIIIIFKAHRDGKNSLTDRLYDTSKHSSLYSALAYPDIDCNFGMWCHRGGIIYGHRLGFSFLHRRLYRQ